MKWNSLMAYGLTYVLIGILCMFAVPIGVATMGILVTVAGFVFGFMGAIKEM